MSIQWTLVASFLYAEIVLVFVLIMPGISNQRWRRILKSRFLRSLENQAGIYFNVLLGILCLLFLDAIREMYAYSHSKKDISGHHRDLDQDMQLSMKTFRAQRNFYISGFSLLLWVVIRRLVTIICSSALTEINLEASRRQSEGAVKEAARLREELDEKAMGNGDEKGSGSANEVAELKDQLEEKDAELRRKSKELEAIKSQSEGLSKEYDRLLDEYSKMEKKAAAAGGDKKSD